MKSSFLRSLMLLAAASFASADDFRAALEKFMAAQDAKFDNLKQQYEERIDTLSQQVSQLQSQLSSAKKSAVTTTGTLRRSSDSDSSKIHRTTHHRRRLMMDGGSGNENTPTVDTLTMVLQDLQALQAEVAVNVADIAALKVSVTTMEGLVSENKLGCISDASTTTDLIFEGCNVHVRNGAAATLTKNGVGNLVVGYNEGPGTSDCALSCDRTGSHNLVVGDRHQYASFGGIVSGTKNAINGEHSTVMGGLRNEANGKHSCISGGQGNIANGQSGAISGGENNRAAGQSSCVSGGVFNQANGNFATISGGSTNMASQLYSGVTGGQNNVADGLYTSILGGDGQIASASHETIPPIPDV